MHLETRAVHAGNDVDPGTGAVRRPIVTANSYALPEDPSELDWSGTATRLYTRNGGANQGWLEDKLVALEDPNGVSEGGCAAVALASGVAALHAVFFTFLRSGDHVVSSDVTYVATHRLLTELLPDRWGITATLVDTSDPQAVRAAMRPRTRLVHVETPANPTTRITDVDAVAAVAHEHGALCSVDATFATPVLQRPLERGADLVVHSLTKYVNGHGDAMGGAVLGRRELVDRIRGDAMVDAGGVISPFNAWLIARGAITLPMRMRAHCANALAVAEFLDADPRIAYVAYPGLASHPQHELAARTLDGGFGGMLAFALDGPPELQNRFVAALEVITSAVSLGHDESLVVHVGAGGEGRAAHFPEPFRRYGHLRLSVGLEDPRDLVADIARALDAVC
ncbi:trans-sulfuration enzyme family protein [Pseudonocardia phyllosphaerae]|uniref:trans-sulfuration enzyme family protein n=1 Tax=Pseudonocardia phyllosphaerae TaxID=3390502 RepID=UPI00397E8A96